MSNKSVVEIINKGTHRVPSKTAAFSPSRGPFWMAVLTAVTIQIDQFDSEWSQGCSLFTFFCTEPFLHSSIALLPGFSSCRSRCLMKCEFERWTSPDDSAQTYRDGAARSVILFIMINIDSFIGFIAFLLFYFHQTG